MMQNRHLGSALLPANKRIAMATVPIFVPVASKPLCVRMNANDSVAIVVNDAGLPAGIEFPGEFVLHTRVPQGHKIARVDIAGGEAICR